MNALSLFSGIGGIDLACDWAGIETVAFCERETFCQKVLKKHWPAVPIYDDVCTLTKERLDADGIGTIELIHGGYPCQPFSHAGNRKGTEDDRHLWPEVFRLIQAINPRWFVGENVAGHITLGLDIVLSDLDSIGYAAEAFVVPASAVDARHRRDRVFIVAYSKSLDQGGLSIREKAKHARLIIGGENVANAEGERCGETRKHQPERTEKRSTSSGQTFPDTTSSGLPVGRRSELTKSNSETGAGVEPEFERCSTDVSDTSSIRQQRQREFIQSVDTAQDRIWQASESLDVRIREQWTIEPTVGRVANGIPQRVDRLKALGNAVVPQQIYPILAAIKQIDDMLKEVQDGR